MKLRSLLMLSALLGACGADAGALPDGGTGGNGVGGADSGLSDAGPPDGSPCGSPGATCGAGDDCCSGLCDEAVCMAGTCAAATAACNSSADCCSGTCLADACAAVGVGTTDDNRDRLLDTLAQARGAADRCTQWGLLDDVEMGVFLTHTDLLGNRSCLANASISSGALDPSGNCAASSNPCQCPIGSDMALDHVFKLWSIRGSDPACICAETPHGYKCCNSGVDWHRTFSSADDWLIAAFRDDGGALPAWGPSSDSAGPHFPFTKSAETPLGGPRGQAHYWAVDADAVTLQRPGVEGVVDPHVVELDNDYNGLHDSNPEGCYGYGGFICTYGRAKYKGTWSGTGRAQATTFAGNGEPSAIAELADDATYTPRCGPRVSSVVDAASGSADALRARAVLRIIGAGLGGGIVHLRTRSAEAVLDAASALQLESADAEILVQLPPGIGTGEAYVYVVSDGVLSNLLPVSIVP